MIESALSGLDDARRTQLMQSLATIRANLTINFESDEAKHG